MATVNIQVKTNKDVTMFKRAGAKEENMKALIGLLKSQMSGSEEGAEVFVSTSATSPVAASGTLTLTYASISNSDTVVIAGSTLTCVTGTPSTNEFKKETDAPTTAANLAALINSHATLSKYVTATRSTNVVTITANQKGSMGNLITIVGSTGIAASAGTLASGTGGAEGVAVQAR